VTASALFAYEFRWTIIWDNLGDLCIGLWLTLRLTVAAFLLAGLLGLPVAMLRMSSSPLLRLPAALWVGLMRGVPLIIVLYWLYYAAASRQLFVVDEFRAGVLALGLTGSAYMAENYRGAVQAVDAGQREAALAIGLGPGRTFVSVVGPQAARVVIPPAVNVLVGLLKGATIVSVIGLADMFYVARTVSFDTFSPFELYTAAAVMVIGVTIAMAACSWLLERYLARGDG
jgi:His/Glu/Gln/Arg/opine family amino acid ABC transporter permease subunit